MNIMKLNAFIILMIAAVAAVACSGRKPQSETGTEQQQSGITDVGAFNADSAYAFTERQVAFGPRVPGTEAHRKCTEWLTATLGQWADTVWVSGTDATTWNGDRVPVRNVFAQFKPEATSRVLLMAHYDTRPWADSDPDAEARKHPFDGANDGASGVGVLLEVARNLAAKAPQIGVDILLTDVEDYGQTDGGDENSWCIGAQQFAASLPYSLQNMPYMGILLDMVGGRDAVFKPEYMSSRYASGATAKVWTMASALGLADRFPNSAGGAVNDDHIPLIKAGIPVTDIIENSHPATGSFNPTWHTRQDNMQNIDRTTLSTVGRVVTNLIYNEKP